MCIGTFITRQKETDILSRMGALSTHLQRLFQQMKFTAKQPSNKLYRPLGLRYTSAPDRETAVLGFSGKFSFLSNFYTLQHPFEFAGLEFDSSERCYMWHKSDDADYKKQIMSAKSASACKRLGKTAQLVPGWEANRIELMYSILTEKFKMFEVLFSLMGTKDAYLEETNHWHDYFWGRCSGQGENHLGRLLMCVRQAGFK